MKSFLFDLIFVVEVDENHNKAEPCLVRARSEQSAKDFSLEETKFLKRKSEDTFNASDSRQSTPAQFLKRDWTFVQVSFLVILSCNVQKRCVFYCPVWSEGISCKLGIADLRTYWAKRNSDSEEIEQTWTEGSIAKLFERGANPRHLPNNTKS